jgi:glycosyltransferase involved in cell wall biosynthesis
MTQTSDFSVAICTYNGSARLTVLLEKLLTIAQQPITLNNNQILNWEITIVDNNSTDNTAEIIHSYQEKFPDNKLRYIFETQQGLAFARRRAIQEAKGSIIGFLDDDNLPDDNWITAAYEFFQQHPQAAACGSTIHGIYEIEPPQHFERIAGFLAIINAGKKAFITKRVMPAGAGIVIRKQAWVECVSSIPKILGRTGNSIASKGEEIEALLYMQASGWEIWYNPQMEIYHHIPSSRLQKSYLMQLCRSIGLSRFKTRTIALPNWQKLPLTIAYFINDLRKTFKHIIKYHSSLQDDVITRCELEFLMASIVSPLYHTKIELNKSFKL